MKEYWDKLKNLFKKFPALFGVGLGLVAYAVYSVFKSRESAGAMSAMSNVGAYPTESLPVGGGGGGDSAAPDTQTPLLISALGNFGESMKEMFASFNETQAGTVQAIGEQMGAMTERFAGSQAELTERFAGSQAVLSQRLDDVMEGLENKIETLSKAVETSRQPVVQQPEIFQEVGQYRAIDRTDYDNSVGNKLVSEDNKGAAKEVLDTIRETGKPMTGVPESVQKEVNRTVQERMKAERPEISFDYFKGTPGL